MDKLVISNLPRTVLFLGVALFAVGCSTYSIPGSQLVGQQNKNSCVDTKTGKAIPGCLTNGKATTKSTREPLRLQANKPVTRKTILTAKKTPIALTKQPISTIGVVASEAKMPKSQTSTMTKPLPITKPVIARPAPKVVTPTKPKPVTLHKETTRRLTLSGSTSFKTGSSSLNRTGKNKLADLARTLTGPNTKISRLLIEGHTDSVGAAAFNQVLSLKRANAVADYLASQGLVRSSMETVGQGESSPIADNKTKSGRAQNRRVEITATGTRQTTR